MAAFEDEWLLMQQGYASPRLGGRFGRLRARLRRGPRPEPRPGAAVRIEPGRG